MTSGPGEKFILTRQVNLFKYSIICIAAFLYSFWMAYEAGSNTVFYGFLLLLSGIPLYWLVVLSKRKC